MTKGAFASWLYERAKRDSRYAGALYCYLRFLFPGIDRTAQWEFLTAELHKG